jgi:hypothetical protein
MSEDMMPKRWSADYDGYMVERDEGDYVEAEDVEPLVAEIERLRAEVEEQARLLGMSGEREAKLRARVEGLEAALRYMLSGWRYIRETYGDLYGVGWNRAEEKARAALEAKP